MPNIVLRLGVIVTPALWKLKQDSKYEASGGYTVRPCLKKQAPLSFYCHLNTYSRFEPYFCQLGKTFQKEYLSCD